MAVFITLLYVSVRDALDAGLRSGLGSLRSLLLHLVKCTAIGLVSKQASDVQE